MKKLAITLAAAAAIIAFGCKKDVKAREKYAVVQQASWIVGEWENQTDAGYLFEKWEKESDSVFRGASYFIKGKDTLGHELMTISQSAGHISFTATVAGQNQNKPVSFAMVSMKDGEMKFENPKHNYPQNIMYRRISADSLVAQIDGMQQGKRSSESYPMHKK
ncbi:MAG: hypothetical protein EOO51_05290 [Flavobacterium sp.]|nr:MAG: hypothetical protein EOO51_05290 [Flavobacterium sp.]